MSAIYLFFTTIVLKNTLPFFLPIEQPKAPNLEKGPMKYFTTCVNMEMSIECSFRKNNLGFKYSPLKLLLYRISYQSMHEFSYIIQQSIWLHVIRLPMLPSTQRNVNLFGLMTYVPIFYIRVNPTQ